MDSLQVNLSPPIDGGKSGFKLFRHVSTLSESAQIHQEQQIRLVMLILKSWFRSPEPMQITATSSYVSTFDRLEQLYVNQIITDFPLTAVTPESDWLHLAETVYNAMGDSSAEILSLPPQGIALAMLKAIHGERAPSFTHDAWQSRNGRYMDVRPLLTSMKRGVKKRNFDIVIAGGGPCGLTIALLLAHSIATSKSTANHPKLRIKVYDQRWLVDSDNKIRWRNNTDDRPNTRRRQVIALQDYVVGLLDEGYNCSLPLNWSEIVWPTDKTQLGIDLRRGGERVYVNSRQAPIRDVEDRLLAELRDSPVFRDIVELIPTKMDQEVFDKLRPSCGLFIGADGAGTKSFTVNLEQDGKSIFDRETLEAHQTDRALGIPIKAQPTATQPEIVFLTLCQTIYLLNSTSTGLGFLNIRLSQPLYDALSSLPPNDRTLTRLSKSTDPLLQRIVALIDAGFRLFGIDRSGIWDEKIDVFRLALASAPKPVGWVRRGGPLEGAGLPMLRGAGPRGVNPGGDKLPVVLIGDAAMQHNFWPGRGANSGLLGAWSLAANVLRAFEIPGFRGLVDAHLAPFEGFMRSLKVREHDGSGRFIQMIDIEKIYAKAFPPRPILQSHLTKIRGQLLRRALDWRDRLGSRPEWKAIHLTEPSDADLASAVDRLCGLAFNTRLQDSPVALMDTTVLKLLETSHQWPTSEMNPLGYDLNPRGFVQPSIETVQFKASSSQPNLLLLQPQGTELSRRRSHVTFSNGTAAETDPAWLAIALLGKKPDFKTWTGGAKKAGEKAYRGVLKEAWGSKFERLYDQRWEQ